MEIEEPQADPNAWMTIADASGLTPEQIATYLAEQGFPAPVRADSGNGAHLLYRVDLGNDEAATALVKGALATLDALFSNEAVTVDTANHNAARIWKLYGTLSRKGDNTPERPHRRAKVLAAPAEIGIVPLERLQHLAALLPREEPPGRKKTNGNGPGIDLAAWRRPLMIGQAGNCRLMFRLEEPATPHPAVWHLHIGVETGAPGLGRRQ